MNVTLEKLYQDHAHELQLELLAGKEGLSRQITVGEVHRPGLCLTGYLQGYSAGRILVFGQTEMTYLKQLPPELRVERLRAPLTADVPAVIVARGMRPVAEMVHLCEELHIPLLRSYMGTMTLMMRLVALLGNLLAPVVCYHGSLMEVFGVGVLIQGESAVGKSEAALGLIDRGHRFVCDDIVRVKRLENGMLEGFGVDVSRYYMEVRGIGIINVASLYGVARVCEKKSLDIVVNLEVWNDAHPYDRAGLDEESIPILGVGLPHYILPVKPGRDVVLLLETLALNHRLKKAGRHAAKDFDDDLRAAIEEKSRRAWIKTT